MRLKSKDGRTKDEVGDWKPETGKQLAVAVGSNLSISPYPGLTVSRHHGKPHHGKPHHGKRHHGITENSLTHYFTYDQNIPIDHNIATMVFQSKRPGGYVACDEL